MGGLPALSNIPIRPGPAAPLWRTVFGSGITIGSAEFDNTRVLKKPITGTDTVTGFNSTTDLQAIFGSTMVYGLYGRQGGSNYETAYVNDGTLADRYATDFTDSLTASGCGGLYTGAQDLSLGVDTRYNNGSGVEDNPQLNLYIGCNSIAAGTADPVDELYIRVVFKLPAALDLQDASGTTYGKFFVIYELKTGGEGNSPARGDLRFQIIVDGTSGTNKFLAKLDNQANLSTSPEVIVYYTNSPSDTVHLDTYSVLHIYYKRPADYNDTTTGILQASIDQAGYGRTVLADIGAGVGRILEPSKSPLMGNFNYPYTRFFGNCYTRQETADLPSIPIIYSDYGFWARPPFPIV